MTHEPQAGALDKPPAWACQGGYQGYTPPGKTATASDGLAFSVLD